MAVNTVGWKGRWASWMRNNPYAVHLRKLILGAGIEDNTLRLYRAAGDDFAGMKIDQDGNASSLVIDSDAANDTNIVLISPGGASEGAFAITRNDDVDGNVVMRLGNHYLWVDDDDHLRIHTAAPEAHNNGTIVGLQE